MPKTIERWVDSKENENDRRQCCWFGFCALVVSLLIYSKVYKDQSSDYELALEHFKPIGVSIGCTRIDPTLEFYQCVQTYKLNDTIHMNQSMIAGSYDAITFEDPEFEFCLMPEGQIRSCSNKYIHFGLILFVVGMVVSCASFLVANTDIVIKKVKIIEEEKPDLKDVC